MKQVVYVIVNKQEEYFQSIDGQYIFWSTSFVNAKLFETKKLADNYFSKIDTPAYCDIFRIVIDLKQFVIQKQKP